MADNSSSSNLNGESDGSESEDSQVYNFEHKIIIIIIIVIIIYYNLLNTIILK